MKSFDYYTTLSEKAQKELSTLNIYGKLIIMQTLIDCLIENSQPKDNEISECTLEEVGELRLNQAFGLIKALADQCQERLISK